MGPPGLQSTGLRDLALWGPTFLAIWESTSAIGPCCGNGLPHSFPRGPPLCASLLRLRCTPCNVCQLGNPTARLSGPDSTLLLTDVYPGNAHAVGAQVLLLLAMFAK